MIPSSIIIEGVMLDLIARAKGPVDGGLFSDIFRGTWNGTDVAIKRLRAYATDETGRRDIRRVSSRRIRLRTRCLIFFSRLCVKRL